MEQAIVLLKAGVAGIDIALSLGYESHSTFSRAFKQVYSTSPSNANIEELHKAIILRVKKGKEAASHIHFDIEERKETAIHGYYRSTPDMTRLPQIANQTFQALLEDSDEQDELSPVGVSMSNPWFDRGDDNTFFFGFRSPFATKSGLETTLIWPTQSYATVIYTGAYNRMWQFISRCHAEIVRRKQVSLSDRTIYQLYLNSPESTLPKDLKTQLFFPVEN